MSQKDFANSIKASPSQITELSKGTVKNLSAEAIAEIYRVHRVNPLWLLTGEGQIFLTASDKPEIILNLFETELVELIRKLPEEQARQVLLFARFMLHQIGQDLSKPNANLGDTIQERPVKIRPNSHNYESSSDRRSDHRRR
jgi:transcriptional regulator with XRE-family HTH domain